MKCKHTAMIVIPNAVRNLVAVGSIIDFSRWSK
jgi:hypothetical protein